MTFAAIETSTPWVLFLGTAIAGLGFGPGFLGAYRPTATVPVVTSGQRAGLITAIYIVSYVATAVPAVIGGIATPLDGLRDTALVYSLAARALTATAAVILLARRPAAPAAPEHTAPSRSCHRVPAPCRHARRTERRAPAGAALRGLLSERTTGASRIREAPVRTVVVSCDRR